MCFIQKPYTCFSIAQARANGKTFKTWFRCILHLYTLVKMISLHLDGKTRSVALYVDGISVSPLPQCVCFTFYMYNAHMEYLCIVNACILNIYNAFIM